MLARPRLSRLQRACRRFHDLRPYHEDPRWPGWQVVVGIETHAQIKARRKLFSESLASSSEQEPNTNVSAFDAAFPGTLPKINPKCVDLALRTALALRCEISLQSSFDRKHYFYGDLPSGYQITQQYRPIAKEGVLTAQLPGSTPFDVRIKQVQLEQDTGKSTFHPRSSALHVDLNRAGVGLMEIVSEPDMRSPEEAGAYVRTLQSVLRAMGSSDGNMEQGSLRCDINVSVNRRGESLGTRCEVKNVNSVKFMVAAIIHEIQRQREFLLAHPGASVPQETRGFDENTFETYRLRSKEDAPDYRYMPDPNLGTLRLSTDRIQQIADTLPPLPWETRSRLLKKYPILSQKEQGLDVLLTVDDGQGVGFDGEPGNSALHYFESVCEGVPSTPTLDRRDPGIVLNWLIHELLGQLTLRKQAFHENIIDARRFGEFIDLVQSRTVTGTSAKFLLREMLSKPCTLSTTELAQSLDLIALTPTSAAPPDDISNVSLVSNPSSPELETLCRAAIIALPKETEAFKSGSKNVLNKIVGYVMRQSRGRADARVVKEVLEELIHKGT